MGEDRFYPAALCPTCRLFGSLDPSGNWAYTGNVFITDAYAEPGDFQLGNFITLEVLSTPKPEGRPSGYLERVSKAGRLLEGRLIGRKLYRHGAPVCTRAKQDRQNKTVRPVMPGARFHFTVEYENLSDEELSLLIYTLVLEDGLAHKIGMGKPLGLGSAKVEIVRWVKIDRQARYKTLGGGITVLTDDDADGALQGEIDKYASRYRNDQSPHMKEFREILRFRTDVQLRYSTQWYGF